MRRGKGNPGSRAGGLVDAPAGISHLSWEIKPSHTLVRVHNNLPGPCSSRAGIATLAVGHTPDFPIDSVTHPMLVWECALCCRVLGALVCSGLWLLISGSPGKPGRLQGLWQSHKEGGESGHGCAVGSLIPGVTWVPLCSAVEVAVPSATAAVPVQCSAQGSMQCHSLQREDESTAAA